MINKPIISKVPGIKCCQTNITPTCRSGPLGPRVAFEKAMGILKQEYMETLKFPANENADFHITLTVDRSVIAKNQIEFDSEKEFTRRFRNVYNKMFSGYLDFWRNGVDLMNHTLENSDSDELEQILDIITNGEDDQFKTYILKCLRIMDYWPGTEEWRIAIVEAALKSDSVEVRDEAAESVEEWGWESDKMLDVLKNHNEPVRWLKDYNNKLIEMVEEDRLSEDMKDPNTH